MIVILLIVISMLTNRKINTNYSQSNIKYDKMVNIMREYNDDTRISWIGNQFVLNSTSKNSTKIRQIFELIFFFSLHFIDNETTDSLYFILKFNALINYLMKIFSNLQIRKHYKTINNKEKNELINEFQMQVTTL